RLATGSSLAPIPAWLPQPSWGPMPLSVPVQLLPRKCRKPILPLRVAVKAISKGGNAQPRNSDQESTMCGIVGAVAQRNVSGILLEGLKRLEYRGYDSAGMALINADSDIDCIKATGKVEMLEQSMAERPFAGRIGIAHTRWATHGIPSEANAHPHMSGKQVALVHNGIIENYQALREQLVKDGYVFHSETDSEAVVHLIHQARNSEGKSLLDAVTSTIEKLHGAYGLCVIDLEEPDRIIVARSGSPLVIGVGIGEHFIASDALALGQVTDRFMYLEEGDIAEITLEKVRIWNRGKPVKREVTHITSEIAEVEKGEYGHFMLKEIYEQPAVVRNTLNG